MNPEVLLITVFVVAGCVVTGRAMATTNLKMAFRSKERMRELDPQPQAVLDLDARLSRIEQAIETIAVEVERNGEAQRYLTRALAKQLPPNAPSASDSEGAL